MYGDIEGDLSNHQLEKLRALATEYNQNHPEFSFDLDIYNDVEKLIFGLWNRGVDVSVLGFGHPYDDILEQFMGDAPCDLHKNVVYLSYLHSEKIPDFLSYSLMLPKNVRNMNMYEKMDLNLSRMNGALALLGKKPVQDMQDFREMLKGGSLNRIELCCLFWEAMDLKLYIPAICHRDFLIVNCGLTDEDKM